MGWRFHLLPFVSVSLERQCDLVMLRVKRSGGRVGGGTLTLAARARRV